MISISKKYKGKYLHLSLYMSEKEESGGISEIEKDSKGNITKITSFGSLTEEHDSINECRTCKKEIDVLNDPHYGFLLLFDETADNLEDDEGEFYFCSKECWKKFLKEELSK